MQHAGPQASPGELPSRPTREAGRRGACVLGSVISDHCAAVRGCWPSNEPVRRARPRPASQLSRERAILRPHAHSTRPRRTAHRRAAPTAPTIARNMQAAGSGRNGSCAAKVYMTRYAAPRLARRGQAAKNDPLRGATAGASESANPQRDVPEVALTHYFAHSFRASVSGVILASKQTLHIRARAGWTRVQNIRSDGRMHATAPPARAATAAPTQAWTPSMVLEGPPVIEARPPLRWRLRLLPHLPARVQGRSAAALTFKSQEGAAFEALPPPMYELELSSISGLSRRECKS